MSNVVSRDAICEDISLKNCRKMIYSVLPMGITQVSEYYRHKNILVPLVYKLLV